MVYPRKRLVKARKARYASHRLARRYSDWKAGRITFAELDASVKGWLDHV